MHFDGNISLGAISLIGTIIICAWKISTKVTAAVTVMQYTVQGHTDWIKEHKECSDRQEKAVVELRTAIEYIRADVAYLRGHKDSGQGLKLEERY